MLVQDLNINDCKSEEQFNQILSTEKGPFRSQSNFLEEVKEDVNKQYKSAKSIEGDS